jgi:hypothetical protein
METKVCDKVLNQKERKLARDVCRPWQQFRFLLELRQVWRICEGKSNTKWTHALRKNRKKEE